MSVANLVLIMPSPDERSEALMYLRRVTPSERCPQLRLTD